MSAILAEKPSSDTEKAPDAENYRKILNNYLYNTSLTIFTTLLPILTFPYVARILGPAGIGKVAFAFSFVGSFIILAGLGIPLYGAKEIAKVRDDAEELNRVFSELVFLNLLGMVSSTLIYLSLFFVVTKIQKDSLLFAIVGVSIILGGFNIRWLYEGLEDFKFLAINALSFLILSVFLILLLVNKPGDYILYAGIIMLTTNGPSIVSIINSRRFVGFERITAFSFSRIKPIFIMFVASIAISIYLNLDIVILGFLAGDKSTGLYAAAIKINRMNVTLIVSLVIILIPRISYLLSKQSEAAYKRISQLSLDFICFLSFPSIVGLVLLAPEIMLVLSGEKFNDAVLTMQILAPLGLIVGINTFFWFQIFIPNDEEKKILIAALLGLITCLSLNLLLVPAFKHNGAAIATLSTEFLLLISNIILGRKHIKFPFLSKLAINYVLGSLIIAAIIIAIGSMHLNPIIKLGIAIILSVLAYFGFLVLRKDELVLIMYNTFKDFLGLSPVTRLEAT